MKVKVIVITFGLLIVMGGLLPMVQAGSTTPNQMMTNAGQTVSLDMSQFRSVANVQPSSLRIAIFDGSQWLEIPFKFSGASLSHVSQPNSSATPPTSIGSSTSVITLTFLMPEPVGRLAPDHYWWSIALHLKLTTRFSFIVEDETNQQITTLYLYYALNGGATAPDYPGLTGISSNFKPKNSTLSGASQLAAQMTRGPFTVTSASLPETSLATGPQTGSDPTIYHHQTVTNPDSYTIQYSGPGSGNKYPNDNGAIFSVEMPTSRAYTHLIVSAQPNNDGYCRYLWIYINSASHINALTQTVCGSFYYDFDVSSYIVDGLNSVGLEITTFVGSWSAHEQLNVQYSASQEITAGVSFFGGGYQYQNTGNTLISFSAELQNATVSGLLSVSPVSYGDIYCRYMDVYVDGQQVSPNGFTICPGDQPFQTDVSSLLVYKAKTTVSIRLTTYSGYWRMYGNIGQVTRYRVWPDSDTRWHDLIHPVGAGSLTLYDTSTARPNTLLGSSSITLDAQEHPYDLNQWLYIGIMTHVPTSLNNVYCYQCTIGMRLQHEIHLTISTLNEQYMHNPAPFASPYNPPGNDGDNTGKVLLTILNGLLTLYSSDYLIPASLALNFIQYLTPPTSRVTVGTETGGVYLKDLIFALASTVASLASLLYLRAFLTTPTVVLSIFPGTFATALFWYEAWSVWKARPTFT